MMGTRGLLNFHLSVGLYLDYYPGELPAQLTGNLTDFPLYICIDVYLFLLNLTYPPTVSQPMNDKHAEKTAVLCYPTGSRHYRIDAN